MLHTSTTEEVLTRLHHEDITRRLVSMSAKITESTYIDLVQAYVKVQVVARNKPHGIVYVIITP